MMNAGNNHGNDPPQPEFPPYYSDPEREIRRRRREATNRRNAIIQERANEMAREREANQPRQDARVEPTLKEMSMPVIRNQPWCIDQNPEEDNFEVKTAVVHHLPKFGGLPGEVASRHLQEFNGICQTLRPHNAPEERFKLKVFPLSLTDLAKSWFLSLPSGSIRSWEQMQRKFLDKYYPPAKAAQLRRELQTIRQGPNEAIYEYLERFNALEQSCSHLGLSEKQLVEHLLDGFTQRRDGC